MARKMALAGYRAVPAPPERGSLAPCSSPTVADIWNGSGNGIGVGRSRRVRLRALKERLILGKHPNEIGGVVVDVVQRARPDGRPSRGHRSRSQSVDIAPRRGYGWITGSAGGAWAAGISPVRALSLPESAVTVTPNAAKAAADAAAESSALMRIDRPG